MNYKLYQGPSSLNDEPILAIVSGVHSPSQNRKTGPMAQVWYLSDQAAPIEALRSGHDASVCGSCPLRGVDGKQRGCYVNLGHGPTAIYKNKGKLLDIGKGLFRNRAVRLGAYGDPASVPVSTHRRILKEAALVTGYTHQWQTCDPDHKAYLMASCDSEEEYELAKELGWKTFRVKQPDDPVLKGETVCPASDEAGKKMQCITCGLCRGVKDVVINAHGMGKKYIGVTS